MAATNHHGQTCSIGSVFLTLQQGRATTSVGRDIAMRKSKDQGGRQYERIDFRRPAFVVLQPNGAWLECMVLDISSYGARLEVGAAPVPKMFMLILTRNGEVRRTCLTTWRNGPVLGARFISLKEIRRALTPQKYVDPRLQKMPTSGDEGSSRIGTPLSRAAILRR